MRRLLRLHHKKKEEKIFTDLIRTVKKQITRTRNLLINLISQRLLVQSRFAVKPLSNDGIEIPYEIDQRSCFEENSSWSLMARVK
jgi:hypothetical protein